MLPHLAFMLLSYIKTEGEIRNDTKGRNNVAVRRTIQPALKLEKYVANLWEQSVN